jgi:flagellar biogenesis protein FliO
MTSAVPEPASRPPQSSFVTVLAWLGIALCGFGTLIGLLQNLMVRTIFQDPTFSAIVTDSLAQTPFPPEAQFMFGHMQYLVLATLLFSVLGLVAFVGLLRRHNWARLTLVAFFGLGILWTIAGIVFQQHMMSSIQSPPFSPPGTVPAMAQMFRIMRIVSLIFGLVFAGLFGWIIVRLLSPRIRAEFTGGVA